MGMDRGLFDRNHKSVVRHIRVLSYDPAFAFMVSVVIGFVTNSLATAGVITLTLSYFLLTVAWIVACLGSLLVKSMSRLHRFFFALSLAVMLGLVAWLETINYEKPLSKNELSDAFSKALSDEERSENPPEGRLIETHIQEPKVDKFGFVYVNVNMKNVGKHPITTNRKSVIVYSSKVAQISPDFIEDIFDGFKNISNYQSRIIDSGQEYMFSISSSRPWVDHFYKFERGEAMLIIASIEVYKDSSTPPGFVYEKHICAAIIKDSAIAFCPVHNSNILKKE
jgi:hypothetical protein